MKSLLIAAGLLLALAAGAQGADDVLSLELQTLRHSDAMPLNRLDSAGPLPLDPRGGRNLVRQDNELRLAYHRGDWRWSLLARQSAVAIAPESTLQLVRDVQGKARPDGDRQYRVELDYRGFAGAGLALARDFGQAFDGAARDAGWSARVELQALALNRLRLAELDGRADYRAATQAYGFALQGQRVQENLRFPFMDEGGPSRGLGLLLQTELRWCGPPWCLGLGLHDLGRLQWRRMPQEFDQVDSQTQSYDADGFLVYKPLLNGRYAQGSFSQSSRQRWQLEASHRSDLGLAELRLDHLQGYGWLPQWGWSWPLAEPGPLGLKQWGLRWHAHERRLGLALRAQRWQLGLGADRLDGRARSRELSLAWLQPF
ncbi:hypothetical protein G8A07_01305 [Roseateles sp. DAIF2]|uniref:hypothetical protein n=1 Tax=Roseateles sp. DAIF2 TaxID=2714952 RepID=UPI0018A287F4|nr:hypothetical protein [Roseateles sp. DAIF2]QPF71698.1 hypothetical protein G8A07_01305 [Roseateles sp. DAIF2]